jgi:hypothetical protein
MKRLLRAVWVFLRKPGQCPSQAGRGPRLSWKGSPVVEGCQGSPADTPFDSLAVLQLDCAAPDARAGHSEHLG